MAEDEDDDMFGDFKFVSHPTSTNQNNQQQNNDEDDWGDFITTPKQQDLQPSKSFSLTHSPRNTFIDPFNIVSNQRVRGALPLSIFGDDDVEEENNEEAHNNIHVDHHFSYGISPKPKFGSTVNISDMIVNLYDQQTQNGSNSNGKLQTGSNGDDEWEFKDASVNRDEDREFVMKESSEGSLFDFGNGTQLNSDWFVAPGRSFSNLKSGERDGNNAQLNGDWFGGHFESGVSTGNTWNPKSPTPTGEIASENVNNIYVVNGIDSDESFGDFMDASPNKKASSGYSQQQTKQIAIDDRNNIDWVNGTNDADESFGDFNDASLNTKAPDSDFEQQTNQIPIEHSNSNYVINGAFASDESFGDFKDASPNGKALNASFEQEELKIADQSGIEMKGQSTIGEIQGNGKALENGRGALPLSIFGDDKLDSEESLFGQEVFSFKPPTSVRKGVNTQVSGSDISLNDLISDLYSQAEKVPGVVSARDNPKDGYCSSEIGLNSTLDNGEDEFDGISWEFKAASDDKTEYSSVVSVGSIHQKLPTESKIVNYLEFYSKLKEEATFIILHHLDDLKNAQKLATLSGEEAKAEALHEEIQAAYKKLIQEKIVPEDVDLLGQTARRISVNELLAAAEEQKFIEFESEYRLSQRISLAEQNMVIAMELFEHAISILKILQLGSGQDITNYTTAWSRMISACAQELNHAASIWKQLLEKNIYKQILSKPPGQEYIIALGEIYRVAEVLRVSATIYKPWILSSLSNPNAIYASFEECNSVWSNSGMDDALQSLSDSVDVKLNGNAKALVESIQSLYQLRSDLELPSSQNKEQTCRLSLLSLQVVPAMKMILWDGEHYFLTLANFWANLVSNDPPKLSHIHVNS